jgi:hypothetical protein
MDFFLFFLAVKIPSQIPFSLTRKEKCFYNVQYSETPTSSTVYVILFGTEKKDRVDE